MLFVRLAETWQVLAATRGRNAKRDILAALIGGVGADQGAEADSPDQDGPDQDGPDQDGRAQDARGDELQIVVSYLSGALRQRRTGVGYRSLADPPEPATVPTLTVTEVDHAFAAMAALAGPGSATERSRQVHDLFGRATADEQELLRGLVSGEVRQGALEAAVQDGLAVAFAVPPAAVRRAAMLLGSTIEAAGVLHRDGLAGLAAVGLRVGVPVQPMLAASAPDIDAGMVKAAGRQPGEPVAVDSKLDGIRVQVHKDGDVVRVFTRSLDEITDRLPQVVAAVAALPSRRLVLDGEALALRPDGRPEAFQVVASRSATHARVPDPARSEPAGDPDALRAYFFDLLRVDDADLLDQPLSARLAAMAEILPPSLLVPRIVTADPAEARQAFEAAVTAGFEGVVVKNLTAPYAAGRRDSAWVKVKPRHTFDLVVTAIEWGHGRRQGKLSNLHLAARDAATGELVMLGKTFKGMTDEMLDWQTGHFLGLETRHTSWTVFVEPTTVVEIACDGLQRSTRYPGGVALRFARVLRYRTDKSAAEADTLDTVRALAPVID